MTHKTKDDNNTFYLLVFLGEIKTQNTYQLRHRKKKKKETEHEWELSKCRQDLLNFKRRINQLAGARILLWKKNTPGGPRLNHTVPVIKLKPTQHLQVHFLRIVYH